MTRRGYAGALRSSSARVIGIIACGLAAAARLAAPASARRQLRVDLRPKITMAAQMYAMNDKKGVYLEGPGNQDDSIEALSRLSTEFSSRLPEHAEPRRD